MSANKPTSWAPSPDGRVYHALEDPDAERKRSLCGLSVIAPPQLHVREVPAGERACRSCLEKLGPATSPATPSRETAPDGTERHE